MNKKTQDGNKNRSFLSEKDIPVDERLIFAMDVSSVEEAKALVEKLGDDVRFYKLGLQMFMAGGYFEFIAWLRGLGKKVFVDLKFFDVPQTVKSAVMQLTGRDVQFVTVHGNDKIMEAAASVKDHLRILAVTALTSLDEGDLKDLGFACSVEELVLSRAKRALSLGCDGVISSGLEARALRKELGERLLIVAPGIRPVANVDDQKRTVGVREAFLNGADYIVVGRPIKDAPDPRQAAHEIRRMITSVFGERMTSI
jgi:orotidine-5'-phosphate decarboxylase